MDPYRFDQCWLLTITQPDAEGQPQIRPRGHRFAMAIRPADQQRALILSGRKPAQ